VQAAAAPSPYGGLGADIFGGLGGSSPAAAPVELQNWCNAQDSLGLDLKGRIKRENNQVSNLTQAG
jgi:hypothetical protein